MMIISMGIPRYLKHLPRKSSPPDMHMSWMKERMWWRRRGSTVAGSHEKLYNARAEMERTSLESWRHNRIIAHLELNKEV